MTSNENQFYADSQRLIDEFMQLSPTSATFLGDHRFDDRLDEYTQDGFDRQRQSAGEWLERLEDFDAQTWSIDAQIDRILIVHILKDVIRQLDHIRFEHRNPGAVVDTCINGVYLLIIRDFAPLPERMKSILARVQKIPGVLADSRELVDPVEVPKVWAEIALETCQRSAGLIAGFIPMLAQATPELMGDVSAAAQAAAAALQEHATWIEETILPVAAGDFAVGEELFNEILAENHMVDYDAEELLATGWQQFEDTQRQMKELAAQMDPDKTVEELLEEAKQDHPTAEGLLDAYREKMAEARQFVIDHGVATIPEGESIRIEPTPTFMRPIIPYAAYMMPGLLEEQQEGVFIVTPVEEDADPEAAENKLRGHPLADIPVTALHEAYPGHHLQLVVSNTLDSLPRKLGGFVSTLFIEGWAFYCEELMDELGFINLPIQKLARLQAQLWRASRIIIDSSLHTGKMSVDEAIDFLIGRAGLEPGDAKTEVQRYTTTPTQPQSYLMGKLQILDIIEEYKRRYPDATMKQMHDTILRCGSLPPKLMRRRLFEE
jgi:uncharacterized protein (DUF885 family)